MARQPKREKRLARVRCTERGHVFTANVWQLGHEVEEGGPGDIIWRVETTEGVTCPQDGSPVEPVQD